MALPVNIDFTYEDDPTDPSVKEHQQQHDALHAAYNIRPQELGYAVLEGTHSNNTTTYDDIPGVSITIDVDGSTPVMLEAYFAGVGQASATYWSLVAIREAGAEVSTAVIIAPSASWIGQPFTIRHRLVPSAGQHTYVVSIKKVQGGGGAATANTRTWLRAVSVDTV